MRKSFDRRVLPERLLDFIRRCQECAPCHLAGGAALAGAYLGHRTTGEVDLFFHDADDMRPLEGIVVESLADLRAAKLTCILSRSEPRDLVDLYFLDRAGFAPEDDLGAALRKDAGIDPGVLSWLLANFPTEPLPSMLLSLSSDELRRFRDELAERLRRAAVP